MKYFQLLYKNQILSLQEKNLMFPQTWHFIEMSTSCSLRLETLLKWVTTHLNRQGITMGICKAKAILADLGTFTHIPAYSEIIQIHSGPCVSLAYSELWYMENQRHIQNFSMFRILVYSEPWYIEKQSHIENYGIFRILVY